MAPDSHQDLVHLLRFGHGCDALGRGTDRGQSLKRDARSRQAFDRLGHGRAAAFGVLRVGANPGARRLAARLVAAFCLRHPGSQVGLHVAGREEGVERLLSGKDDLCLRPASEDRSGLEANPVAAELVHHAPAGHPLANARAIALASLAPEGLVLREPGSDPREALLAAFAAVGISPAIRAQLSSDETVAEAIAAGLGIGLLPEGEAHSLSRAGAIFALDVQGFPLRREWSITRLRAVRLSSSAELFLREAVEGAEGLRTPSGRQPLPA